MVRHSHQDAVSEQVFERLVDATEQLDEPFYSECRFVLFSAGRLGMRAGEICHVREDWIDWDRSLLKIPPWDPCDHGKNGGICGYCRDRAQSAVEHNDDLEMEEALEQRWEPKTSTSARTIPFDFDDRVREEVNAFFFGRERYPHSRASINRRVNRILDAAGLSTDRAYPHSFRATAATYHAYRGLSAAALQALMGWAKLSTANKYVRISGGATQKALLEAHGDD